MTTREADPAVQTRAKRLRFDRYVLDLDRGCLFLDGSEIALRPKTFAVLHCLVENPGRLVSKDELFAAVWPNLAISDDALVQSVGELRRALGADGLRLIRTIPRRGYRFESDVSVDTARVQSSADAVLSPGAVAEAAQSSKAVVRVRTPPNAFTKGPIGSRIALIASFTLAVLIVAGVLWSGAGTGWKFLGIFRSGDLAATKFPKFGAKPAIAVLPLVNQSGDAASDYFADGLTQDIINALGRFSALTVISWNGVLPYKGKPATPEKIGRDLAVNYLVEGSVRRSGDRVWMIAQLVDARQARVLWSTRIDKPLADVFALRDTITTQIAGALAIRMEQIEQLRVSAKPTENLEAYDCVLRARPAIQHPTRADIVQARILLRRAIELDPKYAAAYAALAESYFIATSMGWAESPAAFLSRAEELAIKALSLDDSEVHARIILGRIYIIHQAYRQAEAEIDRAIAINPNDAQSLAGRGNILMWLGQTDAAIKFLKQAQRIDPGLNVLDRFALSLAYYLARRYDAAIEQAELNLRESTDANFSRVILAAAYAQQNRTEDVMRVAAVIRRSDPTFDPQEFGSKLLRFGDLEQLREGFRKAGLYPRKPVAAHVDR